MSGSPAPDAFDPGEGYASPALGDLAIAAAPDPYGDVELLAPVRAGADETTAASAAPSAGRRRLIFFICAIALFMVSIDQTIVATALPAIGSALHSRLNWLGWTITIYSLGQVIMMPLAGNISDQIGRKRLFVVCAALFTAASVACGLSTSIYMLIPLRFIQSLGGGGFLPSASGIVADHFGTERDRALGAFSSIFPVGGVVGPIFGGLITQYWDWRGIFFVNLPIGVVLVALIMRYIPLGERGQRERFDFAGMALLAVTIVAGMLAITTAGEPGTAALSFRVIAPTLVAVVLGALFYRHIRAVASPIIPPNLIVGRSFGSMNFINVLFGGAGFGFGVLIPLYAELRYHVGQSSAGTVLSAQALGMAICAAAASFLLRRTGYRRPMVVGFLIVAGALIGLAIEARGLSPYWWLTIFALISGIGLGTAAPAANNATLSLAPERVAAISGLRAMFRQTGSITCISIVTAALARTDNPGVGQAHVFWVLSGLMVVAALVTFRVPDRRGSW